jgi:hypothetical protein
MIEDIHWLTSPATAPLLQELQQKLSAAGQVDVRLAASLRKSHSAPRTHLLLEQVELRSRARDKFVDPGEMFFTRKGLEQCTDEVLARHKAQRFPPQQPLADLCCGIGGDALSLADRGSLAAWDADPVTAHLAAVNLKHHGGEVHSQLADSSAVKEVAAWHIDPDRRAAGERVIELSDYEPGPEFLLELLRSNPNGAVKVAPGAELQPTDWPACERQWLGSRGECRQQVLWFGDLARQAGQHVATTVASHGEAANYAGHPDVPFTPATAILRYIYEPDATVLAAQLAGALAAEHQLHAITPGGGYLTADHVVQHPLLVAFRVREVMSYDLRKLKSYCREHQLGQLEIKKRGVDLQPHFVRRQIIAAGDAAAVIFMTPFAGQVRAIVAERS